jgi:hypothetical protein
MRTNKQRKSAGVRLLSCLLLLAVVLTTVVTTPVTVEAAETKSFTLTSENAYMAGLCKEGKTPSGKVNIPETFKYDGTKYKVVKISDAAFMGNTKITSVTIPSTIQSIGQHAFDGCTKLKSVTLSENAKLSTIGQSAFRGCTSLKKININENVSSIGQSAFKGCTSLKEISINTKTVGDYVFAGCTSLSKVTFGKKVTEIGNYAFYNTAVESITFGKKIKAIGYMAFYRCTNLKSVTISKKAELDRIGEEAFLGCTSLKEIYINAEIVGEAAFSGCTSLSKVTFGNNVTEIGDEAFEYTAVKSITFGDNITTIGRLVLCGCSKLEEVVIGENVENLGDDIVYVEQNLQSIIIKSTKLKMENCGYYDGAPFDCVEIGYDTFEDMCEYVKIELPEGKEEEYGFLWTTNWKGGDGYIRFRLDSNNAYMAGICKKGKTPSGSVKVPETFTYDGVNYQVVEISFYGNKKITSVEIPATVTEIGWSAFYGCSKLKTVTISKNAKITSIGTSAFNGCTSLKKITLPSTVTEIGENAFYECSKLETVTIPKKAKLSIIGEQAFYGCTSLKKIYINAETVGFDAFRGCTSLEKVTFGDNVKVIGNDAFADTGIKSINFGKNITTIGGGAIANAPIEELTIGENVTSIGNSICGLSVPKKLTIKSTKLKSENCGEYAFYLGGGMGYTEPFWSFTGTITVPKSKISEYKKFLTNSERKVTYKTF